MVRTSIPAAAILVPAAFFLSLVRPRVDRPNLLMLPAPVGAVALSIGLVARRTATVPFREGRLSVPGIGRG